MTTITFTDAELKALHAALRDKIGGLTSDHPVVTKYKHTLEGADLKIKAAMNTTFGAMHFDEALHFDEAMYPTMMKKLPDLNTAIDIAYRTTIDLAQNTPV